MNVTRVTDEILYSGNCTVFRYNFCIYKTNVSFPTKSFFSFSSYRISCGDPYTQLISKHCETDPHLFLLIFFSLTIISCTDKEEYTTTYRDTITTYIKQIIPTINISSSAANPGGQQFGPIADGTSHTLSWTSTNVSSCSASGDWTGAKSVSGTESITEIYSASKTYTLTCTGAFGSTSESVF